MEVFEEARGSILSLDVRGPNGSTAIGSNLYRWLGSSYIEC